MAGRPKKKAALAKLNEMTPDTVVELLEKGLSIEAVREKLDVTRSALNEWLEAPEQAGLLARARVRAADYLATETLTISDLGKDVARDTLKVNTRKWLASKWNAAQYGDSKGVQVNLNMGQLHLEAVKTVNPLREPDNLTINVTSRAVEGEG